MKIAIVQFYTQNVSYGKFSEEINKKYCEEKGYSYIIEKDDKKLRNWAEDRAFTWIKPKLILSVLNQFDYVLFLDIDAIISDFNQRIEEFIDQDYDIIATHDYSTHSVMNAGVLLIKNSSWSLDFMKDWWDSGYYLSGSDVPELNNQQGRGCYKNSLWHDQTCLTYLYKRANRNKHIKIISNRSLNWKEYNENNFVFHAFCYGNLVNRKLDTIYYKLFKIEPSKSLSLFDLANFYGTDKESSHNYVSNYYEKLMEPIRNSVTRFCEIGAYQLASVKMWRDYFPNAEILACDIKEFSEKNDRITMVELDQSDENQLDDFCKSQKDFDVILDDGSHKMRDQQITFAKLFKKLKPGGIYIIEDLHTSIEARMPEKFVFGWGDPDKTTTLEMLENFIEKNRIDSNYIKEEDKYYLENNIEYCRILKKDNNYFSITSVIKKK